MNTEQLLKPRYKVIADYPNSVHKTGNIIESHDHFDCIAYYGCDKYPHLFRKLQWWEERKIEDMPEYVKWIKNWDGIPRREFGDVMKAGEWISNTHFKSEDEGWKLTGGWFEPATEAEYNEYLKTP